MAAYDEWNLYSLDGKIVAMTYKFLRSHVIDRQLTSGQSTLWILRLIHEFWGYCVNGGTSLSEPGGFANISGSYFSSGYYPNGYLVSTGSDGLTIENGAEFNTTSPTFTTDVVGKHLVLWKQNSDSTDDGIYKIDVWLNSSSLGVSVFDGATPHSSSLLPRFTRRNSINYRIVDFVSGAMPSISTSDYLVMTLQSDLVNVGQNSAQVLISVPTETQLKFSVSSNGTWDGTNFTDGDSLIVNWSTALTSSIPGYVFAAASKSSLQILQNGPWQVGGSSWFHVEVPSREYDTIADPSPVLIVTSGQSDLKQASYANVNMQIPNTENTFHQFNVLIRSATGDDVGSVNYPLATLASAPYGRWANVFYDPWDRTHLLFESTVVNVSNNRYVPFRCRLNSVRFTCSFLPIMRKLGTNGEWLHLGFGVLWPWDNAIVVNNLMFGNTS